MLPNQADAEDEAVWRVRRERDDYIERILDDPRIRKRIAELITCAILSADDRRWRQQAARTAAEG